MYVLYTLAVPRISKINNNLFLLVRFIVARAKYKLGRNDLGNLTFVRHQTLPKPVRFPDLGKLLDIKHFKGPFRQPSNICRARSVASTTLDTG